MSVRTLVPQGRMEWVNTGHHYVFENMNKVYEFLRRYIVNYGAEAINHLKKGIMNAVLRKDIFEVQSKMKTLLTTGFPPMTQSSLSFYDDFRILSGIPVFVLHPSDFVQNSESFDVISPSSSSPDGSPARLEAQGFEERPTALKCSVFSRDSQLFVTGHQDGSVRVWDASHGKLKRTLVGPHRGAIADLAFYKHTRFLHVCDFSGVLSIWDIEEPTNQPVVVNCCANWEQTRMPSVEGHWPKLSQNGCSLVCPVQVVVEQQPGQPRGIIPPNHNKRLSSLSSYKKSNEMIGRSPSRVTRPTSSFAHFCILHIFDTREDGITRTAAFGDDEGKAYCWGRTIELLSKAKLYIPLLADSHDYALSSTEISMDGKGLLIGVSSRPNGHLIVWPEYEEKSMHSYRLEGMVGRWSPGDDYIASWDAPLKHALKTDVGLCYIWSVSSFGHSAERCLQNGDDEHPRFFSEPFTVIACPSGNSIYWCDFVSLSRETAEKPQLVGVATCSIGESVQLVLWDFLTGIPVQTFVPGISRRDVILHTHQAWADRWVLVRPSWGLDFISVSGDRTRIGFLSVSANKGIIYDTEKRIERLWMSLTDKSGNHDESLMKNMDLMISPCGDRFATICEDTIMIWLPQMMQCQEDRGVSWVRLASSDNELGDGKLRCKFSRDGQSVGLMRLYSTVMDVWNLNNGQKITLQQTFGADGTVNSPYHNYERDPATEGLQGTPLSVLSPTTGVAAAQKKWFCQFCISKFGDLVATCMGDMSVLLWDLRTDPPTFLQIATLDSRYCAAWAVCFTEGPTGEADSVVVCEDTGCLVWIALHPYPRFVARKDADGKKRCSFSADGTRAVLMPDDIQVRVWDLIDRKPLFSCTYRVWLGKAGRIPFSHNISMDGKKALIGLDTTGKTVLCHPDTTYVSIQETPDTSNLCLVPRYVTVNEDMSWFITDEFHEFDFNAPRQHFKKRKSKKMGGSHGGSIFSSSSARGASSSLSRRRIGSGRVRFSDDGDLNLMDAAPPEGHEDRENEQPRYPNIRERLSDESLWEYLREYDATQQEVMDESASGKLVIMDVHGEKSTKQIFLPNLNPQKFIVISDDGTKVACMDQGNKLNVWSAHAAHGCIPTSQTLLAKRTVDMCSIERDLDLYGPGIVNYQDRRGVTLLLDAVYKKDVALLRCLLSWAKRQGLKISLRDEITVQNDGTQNLNALNLALSFRSPEVTLNIMRYLLEGVCTELETSIILKDSLVKLSAVYPSMLLRILENKRIMMRLHEFNVPEWAFAKSEYKVDATNQLIPTPARLEEMWIQRKLTKQEPIFKKPALKRTSAYSCVMPYPDIAQIGMRGILRPLLFNKVPHHVFATWPIRCVIKFKWSLYGKRLIIEDCVHYVALLFFFTLYVLLIGFLVNDLETDQSPHEKNFYKDGTAAVLTISVLLSVGMLLRKFHQLHVLWESGRWKGIWYWLTDYFNILEVVCYFLIVFLVPMAHIMADIREVESRLLAGLVAMASIFLWAKTLYYAQAFKGTGPLVIMIREIVKDIRFYLFLLFAILTGFAIAFFVLFRNERFGKDCEDSSTLNAGNVTDTLQDEESGGDIAQSVEEDASCQQTKEEINALFGTFDKTMVTMFSMMLGEVSGTAELLFKLEPGLKLVGIGMFVLYLLSVTIVLLNLLIAIMGDGFDRVKATDMSYFLKKRAQIIDDMELGMSKDRQDEIASHIGTYLHVLMPKHKSEVQQSGEWQGRMRDVQQRFNRNVLKAFQQYSEELKAISENQSRLERKIDELTMQMSPSSFPRITLSLALCCYLMACVLARMTSESLCISQSRGHGGGRPLHPADADESSDIDGFFGGESDADSV